MFSDPPGHRPGAAWTTRGTYAQPQRGGTNATRIPGITLTEPHECIEDNQCPFYSVAGKRLVCPFRDDRITEAGVRKVRDVCANDWDHVDLSARLFEKTLSPAPLKARAAAAGR